MHSTEVRIEAQWEKMLLALAKKPILLHQFVALLEEDMLQALKST
jgi:hypothetical protein